MASYLPRESAWKWHPPHRNRWTGKLCDCPWGQPKLSRTASFAPFTSSFWVEAGPHLNRVLKAPDKAYRTPEGQAFLQHLKEENEADEDQHDSLMPWIAHRWKKGDIRLTPGWDRSESDRPRPYLEYNSDPPGVDVPRWRPLNNRLPYWHEWFEARQHPTRRGVNVMDADWTPYAMNAASVEHQNQLRQAEERNDWLDDYANPSHVQPPNVVHRFGPEAGKYKNWQVVKLDPRQAEGDSEALGHCIGQDGQPYKWNIGEGNIDAYSLRDPEGYPHVSWHFNPSGETIGHMQGKSGYPPEHYRNLISQFHDAKGLPDEESSYEDELPQENGGYDDYVTIPGVDNMDDYVSQYHDPEEWYPADANVGYDTEIEYDDHDWPGIALDYLDNVGHIKPFARNDFHHALSRIGHEPDMSEALQNEADFDDPDHRAAIEHYNDNVHPRYQVEVPEQMFRSMEDYTNAYNVLDGTPDHDAIAQEYLNSWKGNDPYDTVNGPYFWEENAQRHEDYDRFHDQLRSAEDHPQFADALRRNVNWQDPYHQFAMNKWNYAFPQNNVMPGQTPQIPPVHPDQMKLVDYRNQRVWSPGRGLYNEEITTPWPEMITNPAGSYIDPDERQKNWDYFDRP